MLVIGFQPDQYRVEEGVDATVDLVAMVISGSLGRDVSISFTTRDGTALGELSPLHTHTHTTPTHSTHTHTHSTHTHTHTAGSDYVTQSSTLTFTPAVNSRSVTVGIIDSPSVESEENFEGFLSVDTPIDRLTIVPAVATVTIGDADSKPHINNYIYSIHDVCHNYCIIITEHFSVVRQC